MTDVNKSAQDVVNGLVDELLDVIGKYAGTMVTATALGCLDIVKAQVIQTELDFSQSSEDEDEDDEMTDREAMKLALEALERSMEAGMTGIKVDQAIAALRQALDHVPDTMKMTEPDMGIDRGAWDDVPDATKWVDELRGGDETEEQEPVAWIHRIIEDGKIAATHVNQVPPEKYDRWWESLPLYAAPPKREWVGLTDEEEIELDEKYGNDFNAYIDARDAKLREKNGF